MSAMIDTFWKRHAVNHQLSYVYRRLDIYSRCVSYFVDSNLPSYGVPRPQILDFGRKLRATLVTQPFELSYSYSILPDKPVQ